MKNYSEHRKKWKNCERCDLCQTRKHVVLARGTVPCDVLFAGEAPGQSEDVLGRPFVGPAGKLLDRLIARTLDGQYDYCLTNVVACIPIDAEAGGKAGEPPKASIKACAPRLQEMIELAQPSLIVRVGKLATKHVITSIPTIDITHPAAILRMDVTQQGLAYQRCYVAIEDALEELEEDL